MASDNLLLLDRISKSFVGVKALEDVSFDLRAGEVHALCGENGAGKSTLMKILGGHFRPSAGTLTLNGEQLDFRSPSEARRKGVLLVHQEISLAPDLTVAENIFLGNLPRRGPGLVRRGKLMEAARAALDQFGFDLDPGEIAGNLSIARQQMVEVARVAAFSASVVIFDEPTASLTDREAAALFRVIETLKARGVGVVYISHRMDEIFRLSDRITVLRDGRLRGTLVTAETDEADVTRMMIGRNLEAALDRGQRQPGKEVLRVEALTGPSDFEDISLSIREGEIVGLYGLVGAGRSEFAETVFGMRPAERGQIFWHGEPRTIRSSRDAIELGIGLVPESRKEQGLVLGMSCQRNLSLGWLPSVSRFGLLRPAAEVKLFAEFQRKLSISAPRPGQAVTRLSGGNQQKIVIGKWLNKLPSLLIVDEPTRGIDVGSKAEIHKLLLSLAGEGLAILVISSDMPEIMRVSDRILTMYHGRLSGAYAGAEITEENLISGATGITSIAASPLQQIQ